MSVLHHSIFHLLVHVWFVMVGSVY